MPVVCSNLDRAPALVGKAKIDAPILLGDAQENRSLRPIELRSSFQQIEGRANGCVICGFPCGLIVAPPEPGAEAGNRPRFSMLIDGEIGKSGAIIRVK